MDVCHITAASPGGPRYNPNITKTERTNINNAILLCKPHSILVDKYEDIFTEEVLHKMKTSFTKRIAEFRLLNETKLLKYKSELHAAQRGIYRLKQQLNNSKTIDHKQTQTQLQTQKVSETIAFFDSINNNS